MVRNVRLKQLTTSIAALLAPRSNEFGRTITVGSPLGALGQSVLARGSYERERGWMQEVRIRAQIIKGLIIAFVTLLVGLKFRFVCKFPLFLHDMMLAYDQIFIVNTFVMIITSFQKVRFFKIRVILKKSDTAGF